MTNTLNRIEQEYNIKIIYCSYVGSKLYGTDNKNSDQDLRFIYINSKENILLEQGKSSLRVTPVTKEKNTKDAIDFDGWSINNFFNLVSKGDTNALDLLFSTFRTDTIVYQDNEFIKDIQSNYLRLLNRNIKGFVGYCLGQVRKYGIKGDRFKELESFIKILNQYKEVYQADFKLESIFDSLEKLVKDNNYKHIKFLYAPGPDGTDWKYINVLGKMFHKYVKFFYFLDKILNIKKSFGNRTKNTAKLDNKLDPKSTYHALRVAQELEELLLTNKITFPLKTAKELRVIKEGSFSPDLVVQEIERVIDRTDELLLKSNLPEESDKEFMKELTIKYSKKVLEC